MGEQIALYMDKTLMEYDSSSVDYELTLEEEYNKAVEDGFSGTFEEYLQLKDYT